MHTEKDMKVRNYTKSSSYISQNSCSNTFQNSVNCWEASHK